MDEKKLSKFKLIFLVSFCFIVISAFILFYYFNFIVGPFREDQRCDFGKDFQCFGGEYKIDNTNTNTIMFTLQNNLGKNAYLGSISAFGDDFDKYNNCYVYRINGESDVNVLEPGKKYTVSIYCKDGANLYVGKKIKVNINIMYYTETQYQQAMINSYGEIFAQVQ